MREIDSNTLFLSGIIVLCFSFLLFHINPYQIVDTDFWLWIQTFLYTLVWRPMGTIGMIVGTTLLYKAIKRN
ncbi:TPA: hypothetical protein ACGO28_000456 [Streptococcus suis]